MKILITGATGFVGKHLVQELQSRGHALHVPHACEFWCGMEFGSEAVWPKWSHQGPVLVVQHFYQDDRQQRCYAINSDSFMCDLSLRRPRKDARRNVV